MRTIVIFIGGYLPARKYGGPVTSIVNIVENMGDEFRIKIVCSNHDFNEKEKLRGISEGWNKVGKAEVLYIEESKYKRKYFERILRETRADMVYLSSVFYYKMNFPAIKAAKSYSIPVILAPRGEICKNAFELQKIKKIFFVKLVKLFGIYNRIYFQTTSQEEYEATLSVFGCDSERVYLLPNMPCAITEKREGKKQAGFARFVFISRIQEKKNLLFAIEQISKLRGKVILDIYGPLEQKDYWEKCEVFIRQLPPNVQVTYRGLLKPGESKKIFGQYDFFVFPTMSENYGHVIVEAITSGCPLIISEGTTPWDDIMDQGGFVVNLEEKEKWREILQKLVDMDSTQYEKVEKKLKKYVEQKLKPTELKRAYKKMFFLENVRRM